MSKKRTIDSRIRTSQTFAQLTYRQRDLWQGLIATADDQGRLPGIAAYVRSQVWPYDDIPLSEVEADISRLIELKMIYGYTTDGKSFIQIVNWWKYQVPQWAGPSDHPAPDGWVDRMRYHGAEHKVIQVNWDNEGGFNTAAPLPPNLPPSKPPDKPPRKQAVNQVSREEEEEEEGNKKGNLEEEGGGGGSRALSRVATAYQNNIALITPMTAETIRDWESNYPEDWVLDAIKIAHTNRAKSDNYVTAVLERWKRDGRNTELRPNGRAPTAKESASDRLLKELENGDRA